MVGGNKRCSKLRQESREAGIEEERKGWREANREKTYREATGKMEGGRGREWQAYCR